MYMKSLYIYILVYIGYIGSMIEYGPKVDFFLIVYPKIWGNDGKRKG